MLFARPLHTCYPSAEQAFSGSALESDEMRLNRHCERSEAIHRATRIEWIASSLSLLAMTTKSVIEPEIIMR
jgi:hypothetical protein